MSPGAASDPYLNPADGARAAGVLRAAFAGARGISCAFVFGSLACRRERPDSDLDLFVVGTIDGRTLSGLTRSLGDESIGRLINAVHYTESELVARIRDRSHFVLNVLSAPIIFVRGTEHDLARIAARASLPDGDARDGEFVA